MNAIQHTQCKNLMDVIALCEAEEQRRGTPSNPTKHKTCKDATTALLEEIASLLEDCLRVMETEPDKVSPKARTLVVEDTKATISHLDDLLAERRADVDPHTEKSEMGQQDYEPVDTLNGQTRHLATIGKDNIAHTKCGKGLVFYLRARHHDGLITSYWHSDGTRWVKPCRHCLPEDYKTYRAAQR